MADLRVTAVMQPVWMQRDPCYHQAYLPTLGKQRCDRMMPLRSLLDRGIGVVSSTDFPIVHPPSPLDGIAVGTSADLVVLNENILAVPAEQIGFSWMGGGTTTVVRTVFQGRTVFVA